MGTVKRGEGMRYLHVSCGKMKESTGKKDEDGKTLYQLHDGYEGIITEIKRDTDEFEGKTRDTVVIKMKDPASPEVAQITMTAETFFTAGLFARLPNIDPDKPFVIGVMPSDQNDKVSFAYAKQGGKKVEKAADFPQPKKVKVGKTEVYDYTDVNKAIDEVISSINDYFASLAAGEPEITE